MHTMRAPLKHAFRLRQMFATLRLQVTSAMLLSLTWAHHPESAFALRSRINQLSHLYEDSAFGYEAVLLSPLAKA